MVYVLTAFFIILYGLKFGRVKSLCWLTSITIGILQGVVVSSPFKIDHIFIYNCQLYKVQNFGIQNQNYFKFQGSRIALTTYLYVFK